VPHAQHTSRALESVNNDFPSWWSREQRAELTYREISPRDGRKKTEGERWPRGERMRKRESKGRNTRRNDDDHFVARAFRAER